MRQQNLLLAAASHRVIARFGEQGRIRGAAFNKLMTLLNRRLLHDRMDQRLDLNLPHCWYLFGDEVVPWELPQEVRFEPQQAPIQKTVFRWEGPPPATEDPQDWRMKRVASELERIESEFGNPVSLTAIVDEVYDEAPFEFQPAFLALRRRLRDTEDYWKFDRVVDGMVVPTFEQAIHLFPTKDFPQLVAGTTQYRRLMRHALELGLPALGYVAQFTELYWQAFCYLLRIHPRGHQNVSGPRVEMWTRAANDYLPSLSPRLTALAVEMVGNLDTRIDPLDRAALIGSDWGSGSENTSVEVHSLAYR